MVAKVRGLKARSYQLFAAGLMLFFLCWDLWAIFTDNRVGAADTILEALPDSEGLLGWLRAEVKGPLVPALVSVLNLVIGFEVLSARLLGVLAHAGVLWMVYLAAARLSSSSWAGLAAVLVCGCVPGSYGWFREEYHEGFVSFLVMATMLLMTVERLTLRRALWLGLALGLGVLAKPAYLTYVCAPGLLFVAAAWRHRQSRAALGSGLALALLVAGWWLALAASELAGYAGRSTSGLTQHEYVLSERYINVMMVLPGALALVVAALLGGALCSRLGTVRVGLLWLYAAAVMGAVCLMLFVFDPLSRYMAPILPVAAVLAGVGLQTLREQLGRFAPRVVVNLLLLLGAVLLLGRFGVDNVRGYPVRFDAREQGPVPREAAEGLVSPDGRPYRKALDAIFWLERKKCPLLEVVEAGRFCVHMDVIWKRRQVYFAVVPESEHQELLRRPRAVCIALCHGGGDADARLRELAPQHLTARLARVVKSRRVEVLRTFRDPDGSRLSILALVP